MSDVLMVNVDALLLEKDDMDAGVVSQLRSALAEAPEQFDNLKAATDKLERDLEAGKGDAATLKLKAGIANFLIGKNNRAVEMLGDLKKPLALFYHGLALNHLRRHEEAFKSLEKAGKAGYAASQVEIHKAAALRELRKLDEAKKTLEALDDYVHNTADYQYQYGAVLFEEGAEEEAVDHFERAVAADDGHSDALFRLAQLNDLQGNDRDAIDYYERCLQTPPPRVGTLINLGVLYEDNGRYDKAARCYQQVLKTYPNHGRAKLFYKDASASRHESVEDTVEFTPMVSNAKMDTPVTDFELSVRARNCLQKMGIESLGDLCQVSKQQLLNSKNFGETSLQEIEQMLTIQGLRLGQNLEVKQKRPRHKINPDELSPQEQTLYEKPISELNFSVRARKCMTRLSITKLGELVAHTGDDLLECKNFGVTSLVEVRDKLATLDLKLRGD